MSSATGQLLGQHLPSCPPHSFSHRNLEAESWAQIRQKLRDFYHDTQVMRGQAWPEIPSSYSGSWHMPLRCQAKLERERAELLVRATKAEAQLSELQEYVDQHLGR